MNSCIIFSQLFLASNVRYSLIAETQSRGHFHGGKRAVQELKFTILSGRKRYWAFPFIEAVVEAFECMEYLLLISH